MKVYPLMRYKWWFVGALGAVTIFAITMVFVVGLNYGIDFKGGVRVELRLTQSAPVEDVRAAFAGAGVPSPVVQPAGNNSFLITAESMTDAQLNAAITTLKSYGAEKASTGSEAIGPSFGAELERKVLIAILIDFLVLIAYISWRFQFKFAIPAIVALFHDVGLILGLYAVTGRIVTAATVAAVLTILGYSMHDTIIVFDRIRENVPLMTPKQTYSDMVDLSIRQTLGRSINTSVTAMLPIASIWLFGGVTLKDFAFALTIGIFTGTYSSFFVASPLLVIWKEREPKYKKRLLVQAPTSK
jgi:SecD/SecF fusion protein